MKTLHLLALALVSTFLASASQAADKELHLLCWTEYVPATLIESFSRATGAKVLTEYYNSNEQMMAKLKARPSYYDLVQPSQAYVEALVQADGLEPLDRARLPHWHHLDPKYLGLPHDPENRFSMPWLSGTVGIVVDTAQVAQPITTWADVFADAYRGRIVIVDDPREMVAWALASLGLPITDIGDENLARVEPVLRAWLPLVGFFDSDSPHRALASGKAVIGIVWSGEAALLWQQDHRFHYIVPKEGGHMFLDSLAIPAKAPHKSLAEDFINYCLAPEVSALISNAYPYTNPNLAARELLTAEQRANPASYLPGDPLLSPLRNRGNDIRAVEAVVRRIRSEVGQ